MKTFLSNLLAFAIAAALVVFAGNLGLWLELGAHPFWAEQVGWLGVLPAAAFWVLTFRLGTKGLWLAVPALGIAAASAYFGKAEFAASYAENALAGRFWYFGWIAVTAAVIWVLAITSQRSFDK